MTNTICDLMMNEAVVSQRRCPSCGKTKILSDENTGELFCGSCGFVITEKLADTGAEWRSFSQDEGNRARTGAGTSLTDENTGELFCGSCGFVITEKLADTGAEWRSFSQDEGNRARTGAGTSL